jgi:polysaccharide biosynthesis protein PslJ
MGSAVDSVRPGRPGMADDVPLVGEDGTRLVGTPGFSANGIRPRRTDGVTLLTWYLFLLLAIPAPLVFAPLGGAGGPATIFAFLLLGCYLLTLIHPALVLDKGPQPIRVAAVVLTCAVIVSYISANRRTLPGLEENGADRGLIIMLGWLGIMLLAADGIGSMDRLKTLLSRLIFGATALATLAIAQFFTGLNAAQYIVIPGLTAQTPFTDLLTRDQLNRPSATATDPIELAVVLAICLPIAVHRARFAPKGRRARRWVQVGLIGMALPMTVSRTAIVALIVASFVVLPTWPKWERRAAYVVGLLAGAVLFTTTHGLLGEFRTLFSQVGSDTSSTSRTGAFASSMPFVAQHPWFGRGFGTFLPATYFFTDDQFLLTLIEIGFIGLAALLALFITGWMTARNARRMSSAPETRHLAQCLAATVAVAAVSFATLDVLSFAIAAGLTFLTLGCVGALWRLVRLEKPPSPAVADASATAMSAPASSGAPPVETIVPVAAASVPAARMASPIEVGTPPAVAAQRSARKPAETNAPPAATFPHRPVPATPLPTAASRASKADKSPGTATPPVSATEDALTSPPAAPTPPTTAIPTSALAPGSPATDTPSAATAPTSWAFTRVAPAPPAAAPAPGPTTPPAASTTVSEPPAPPIPPEVTPGEASAPGEVPAPGEASADNSADVEALPRRAAANAAAGADTSERSEAEAAATVPAPSAPPSESKPARTEDDTVPIPVVPTDGSAPE